MDFKAVLFDLDGTLLDSLEDLADSMNAVLHRQRYPEHPVEAYKYFVGDGIEALARRALPEAHRDEEAIAACVREMRQEYGNRWDKKTRPYPGIPELLDELSRRGVKMTVFSNKPDETTRVMVARLLPRWRFERVRGERPGTPRKPDPAGALEIARELGLSPEEFLYVGDTDTDMKTALAAGMFPVGVLWGFRDAGELEAHGARAIIKRPLDLLTLGAPAPE